MRLRPDALREALGLLKLQGRKGAEGTLRKECRCACPVACRKVVVWPLFFATMRLQLRRPDRNASSAGLSGLVARSQVAEQLGEHSPDYGIVALHEQMPSASQLKLHG